MSVKLIPLIFGLPFHFVYGVFIHVKILILI